MFRKGKFWLILTFTVLTLVASVTISSFAFQYTGIHWYDADLPVTWEINQNGTADCTGEFQAVRAGYQTWEDVTGSYFTETYLGTTTRGLAYDGHNVVSWGDSESEGVLAVCYTWYDSGTGRIFECDIEFQDKYTWSSTGEGGKFDVQNIGAHEFGHTLLLGDLYGSGDTEKTMYGYASLGETKKRTLHQDDIDGICYIYPESGNQPPNTPSAPTGPDSGTPGTSYGFSATTTDPDGDQVAFKFSWGDGTESGWTSFVASGGSASKSHSWSNSGTYEVKVKAKDTYNAESGWSAGHEIVVGQPPNTPPAPSGPDSGTPGTSYSFTATTTDPDGDQVAFNFDWGDGTESGWTSFVASGGSASMSHSWSSQGTFDVRARAKDTYGAESGWSVAHQIVTGHPPNTPSAPSGPDTGTHGPSYSFSATTTDPDGDQVAFKFNWGDGTESDWTSFVNSGGSASLSHSWSGQMTYEVRAKAKDTYGGESGWSAAHDIVIGQPPATPSAPSGPDSGMRDVSYSFSAVTTDPDGDQVAFKFDWGDGTESGWTSFVDSGSSASKSHSWATEGTYQVKVKAKDTYNAESGWSASHPMTIRAILLEVDPSYLDFGEIGKGSSKTMTFRAYNAGAGTLSGNVSDNRNWISVSPTSFEGNDNTISVTVVTEGLAESLTSYTGTVTVTSNGGTKTVEVSVIVVPTGAVAYPNPFSLSKHTNLAFWGTYVPYVEIQIFTLGGDLVRTLVETGGASKLSWDGRNEKGDKVARGIYVYIVKEVRGKIAVVK